jgi:hypothetical protein
MMACEQFELGLSGPLVSATLLISYASSLERLAVVTGQDLAKRVEALYEQASALSPVNAVVQFAIAEWNERCGKNREARIAWLKALDFSAVPEEKITQYLAFLRRTGGDVEAAQIEEVNRLWENANKKKSF